MKPFAWLLISLAALTFNQTAIAEESFTTYGCKEYSNSRDADSQHFLVCMVGVSVFQSTYETTHAINCKGDYGCFTNNRAYCIPAGTTKITAVNQYADWIKANSSRLEQITDKSGMKEALEFLLAFKEIYPCKSR